MKIAICGHGEHGKDMTANILAEMCGLRYTAGTSWWARDMVFARMTTLGHAYGDSAECWGDRRNNRVLWAEIIGELNAEDPVRLYRDCLAEQDLLTGIRWWHEFDACRKAKIVDKWIFVRRAGWPLDSTCQITEADCDHVIDNDGSQVGLSHVVRDLAIELGILR